MVHEKKCSCITSSAVAIGMVVRAVDEDEDEEVVEDVVIRVIRRSGCQLQNLVVW